LGIIKVNVSSWDYVREKAVSSS